MFQRQRAYQAPPTVPTGRYIYREIERDSNREREREPERARERERERESARARDERERQSAKERERQSAIEIEKERVRDRETFSDRDRKIEHQAPPTVPTITDSCCMRRARIGGSYTLVSLSLRLKDLLGPVTRVKKKKKGCTFPARAVP